MGGEALLLVALVNPSSRDLVSPLRHDWWPILSLSLGGMALAQFLFHLALGYASVVQVATLVTTMPIFVVFAARVVLSLVVGFARGIWLDPTTLADQPLVDIAAIIALGVRNTCIGFILWLWGLAHIPNA